MKNHKLIIAAMILFAGLFLNTNAQYNISTSKRITSIYNETTKQWEQVSVSESYSFFKINKDFTIIEHTTEKLTSAYKVTSRNDSQDENRIDLNLVSDVGNQYELEIRIDKEDLVF